MYFVNGVLHKNITIANMAQARSFVLKPFASCKANLHLLLLLKSKPRLCYWDDPKPHYKLAGLSLVNPKLPKPFNEVLFKLSISEAIVA